MTNGIVIGLSALAGVSLGWFAVPVCLSAVAILLLIERRFRWPLLLACLIFSCFGSLRSDNPSSTSTSEILASSTGAIGRIDSFPRPAGDGHRVILAVTKLCIDDQCVAAEETVVLYVAHQNSPIAREQVVRVDWRLDTLQELPPGYRSFVQSQDATASARADIVEVINTGPRPFRWLASANNTISERLSSLLPGDTGALATGIVTGDDSDLSNTSAEYFRATGTAHITAVSGQNVTIILGFLTMWWQPKTIRGRWFFHIALLMVIWSYATLVGLEAPAFRAAMVASLTIFGSHVGRRPDPVTLLFLTIGAMALAQPMVVHGIGFWLSVAASAALCLALPRQLTGRPGKSILEIAMGPIAASLATMPIVLMAFGTWSPVSMLANILIAPVITLAFWATYPFVLIALIAPGMAGLLAWIPGILIDFALVIVERLAPIAGQIRVDAVGPWAMLMLWLPIGTCIWLISGESDRWIRHALRSNTHRDG